MARDCAALRWCHRPNGRPARLAMSRCVPRGSGADLEMPDLVSSAHRAGGPANRMRKDGETMGQGPSYWENLAGPRIHGVKALPDDRPLNRLEAERMAAVS